MTRAKWVGRAEFAEVAEALGITSDMVMAVHSDGSVLWTENDEVRRAHLERDADGILVVGPKQTLASVEEFMAEAKRVIHEELGRG